MEAVADAMGISINTVKGYCKIAFKKLNVTSSNQACAVIARWETKKGVTYSHASRSPWPLTDVDKVP